MTEDINIRKRDYRKLDDGVSNISCVYLLFNKQLELIYVGKAKNFRNRLSQHLTQNKDLRYDPNNRDDFLYKNLYITKIPFNTIEYYALLEIEEEKDRCHIEECLIYCLNPKYNTTYS